ncbi:hypothetical protein CAEBREN_02219 [Caenorhabditis brenneri]|uniref:Uncharacterized protein n=1 Tax=Caenorhabditis brenneri TaxID=135651 RepID=G0NXJ2_CAEBE|nr:hypothetical protein CAEBREN_02219 [Caenorhabditis brenneri]
MVYKDVLYYLR